MRIGVDFDNTVVCHDPLFHKTARTWGVLEGDVPADKFSVREHLRGRGMEDVWIELQGHVYGSLADAAEPYPGALEFFESCAGRGAELFIISHRTRHPVRGAARDLHESGLAWLESRGFISGGALSRRNVHFELTRDDKIARIRTAACDAFIDDLPEFLGSAGFSDSVQKILFDPHTRHAKSGFCSAGSWADMEGLIRWTSNVPVSPRT